MGNNGKALRSGAAYAAASVVTAGMAFVTTPIFTRLMSGEAFGDYNNFLSWQAVLSVIVSLNLDASFISARFDYEDDFDSYVFSMACLCALVIGCFMAVVNMGAHIFQNVFDMDIGYINVMVIFIMASRLLGMFQAREQYEFHYKISVFVTIGLSVSSVLLAILLVSTWEDKLRGRVAGFTVPTIFAGCVLFCCFWKRGRKVRISYWRYALPICIPYIPHSLSLNLLYSLDRIIVRKVCGSTETALYSLAYTCSSIVTLLMGSMNTAYSPWLARHLAEKKHKKIREFSYVYIAAFFTAVFGMMLVAPEVLYVLGGKKYMGAVSVMPPVMAGCAFQLLYTMHVNIEQFHKRTVGMAAASASAALLNYLLNWLLVPKYGYGAAAYTTWISYLFLLAIHMFLVARMGFGKVYDRKFIFSAIGISTAFMLLMLFLYRYLVIRYVVLAVYAACVFLLAGRCGKKMAGILKE